MKVKGVDEAATVPLFQRAIRLDPNFAMAYASLGNSYSKLGERSVAADNTRKAYELLGKVSEREQFYIESHTTPSSPATWKRRGRSMNSGRRRTRGISSRHAAWASFTGNSGNMTKPSWKTLRLCVSDRAAQSMPTWQSPISTWVA
jgi:tetratricopeptide (TPR) repeat protein